MTIRTSVNAVILCASFYYYVIVLKIYAQVLLSFSIFVVCYIPTLALMKWHFNVPIAEKPGLALEGFREGEFVPGVDPAYEVCILTMPYSMLFSILCAGGIGLHDSWMTIAKIVAMSAALSIALTAYTTYKMGWKLNDAHISFARDHAPGIIARYIARLPLNIWGDVWWAVYAPIEYWLGQVLGGETQSPVEVANATDANATDANAKKAKAGKTRC